MNLSDPVRSKKVFDSICAELDSREWAYNKFEDELRVAFIVQGEDLPMKVIVDVNDDMQFIAFVSPIPVSFPQDKLFDGAIAVSYVNDKLVDGCFDYNIKTGEVWFRLTNSYIESDMGPELFKYIIDLSLSMVDEFNDMFAALATGQMTIKEFIEKY